jgi:hypothetical protein
VLAEKPRRDAGFFYVRRGKRKLKEILAGK